jgi:hypothetical protein
MLGGAEALLPEGVANCTRRIGGVPLTWILIEKAQVWSVVLRLFSDGLGYC